MSQQAVQVGVIGWGNFFGHIHEQTLRDLITEGRCHLRAVCVRSPETRAAITARMPADYHTADAQQVLSDPRIQAILVGAPQSIQAQVSRDAIAAGKWVYVEKPMFADETDTGRPPRAFFDELAALGRPALERLAVGLNKRFAPAYRELRDLCREWGGVRHLQINVVDDAWRWGAKYPPGFLMWLDVCHWLDLARWFTGAEVASLSCLFPQVEDSQITLKMTDGSVTTILLSGNGTMDMFKEELRVITAGRRCATVTDFVQMEIFGGPQREVRSYKANLQSGGDLVHTRAIDAGGLDAFRSIRRQVFDRFQSTRAADPAGDAYVKKNIPNFMRPQGWNESMREFIAAIAAQRPLTNAATFRDAYISYELLETTRASVAAQGQFVQAVTVPPLG